MSPKSKMVKKMVKNDFLNFGKYFIEIFYFKINFFVDLELRCLGVNLHLKNDFLCEKFNLFHIRTLALYLNFVSSPIFFVSSFFLLLEF